MLRASCVASLFLLACGRHDQPAPSPTPPASAPAGSSTTARPAPPPPPPTAGGSAADLGRPCSKISAAEVSEIVGFTVTAHDEHYRCKFVDPKDGWLQVELLESASRSAHDICEYGGTQRTVVPGVGDSASNFGATACVKVGDVEIVVDATNLAADSPALHGSGAQTPQIRVAKVVASRIP